MSPKVLHLDENHPLLLSELSKHGFENIEAYHTPKEALLAILPEIEGIILRSRFKLDKEFLQQATQLRFIGRVGAGLENIDEAFASQQGIQLFNAPEGNRNAVGEHALGMLLSLLNKLHTAHQEVCKGSWRREANRGYELDGKTVGIIGYGNMGKAFAKKLRGFEVKVLCYDLLPSIGDAHATQVSLAELQYEADVVSLHTPITPSTYQLVDADFINGFRKSFWFINTARGNSVVTSDLVAALKSGKVLGAGLDVLEYEKTSFEQLFEGEALPEAFAYLTQAENVLLTPHIAGWTLESKEKLAQIIVSKIFTYYATTP